MIEGWVKIGTTARPYHAIGPDGWIICGKRYLGETWKADFTVVAEPPARQQCKMCRRILATMKEQAT
jgi:hypothetical protein